MELGIEGLPQFGLVEVITPKLAQAFCSLMVLFWDFNGVQLDLPDSSAKFLLSNQSHPESTTQEASLESLVNSWQRYSCRRDEPDSEWVRGLRNYLDNLVDNRIECAQAWLKANTSGLESEATAFLELHRRLDALAITLKQSIQLCESRCNECQLTCLQPQHHIGPHNCRTSHRCEGSCALVAEHIDQVPSCGLPLVLATFHISARVD